MISFNNIPTGIRTPGIYTEVDNSRALKGLLANPHRVLLIGQKTSEGSKAAETLQEITSDGLADGFFGAGSQLAIMCNMFKQNNPNTELHAVALSDAGAGVKASGAISFSVALGGAAGSAAGTFVGTGTYNLMIDGIKVPVGLTSGYTPTNIASAAKEEINGNIYLPVTASVATSGDLTIIAKNAGSQGNYIDIRANYYTGQNDPASFSAAPAITAMAGGATDPSIDAVWAIVADTQYHYIGQPYDDAANLTSLENELEDRFGPMVDLQGHGFMGARKSLSDASALGNSRNSPFNTIMPAYGSPSSPARWTAALTAIAGFNLNQDPARPLHYLKLKGILPPQPVDRFNQSERNILLYDGCATWVVDSGGNVVIERCITTYQTNAAGGADTSYLDIQTMATLSEIRYQYKSRMMNRFLIPRFKLADDTFPVQPGTNVCTPRTVKDEIIALFTQLRDQGLIENLEEFKTNLVVERDVTDVNRVNALLPPDLINQFRVLGSVLQFIL